MSTPQDATDAPVRIRAPRRDWIWFFMIGGVILVPAGLELLAGVFRPDILAVGLLLVAEGLWVRTRGVDLTPELAIVRGLRRQSIPWPQVQAVLQNERLGARRVKLILDSGSPVTLLAPTTRFGFGAAEYQRDLERIGHWWLAHRGESWRPMRPEAPRLPASP